MAMAKVESRLNPWALNVEGHGAWYNSKEDALKAAWAPFSQGRSLDVGLMQVNSRWLRKYDIPLEAALDPLANAYLGAWLLKSERDRLGELKPAIGAYHSPSADRANKYVDIVLAALSKISGSPGEASKSFVALEPFFSGERA
jgi:hypothetical protein